MQRALILSLGLMLWPLGASAQDRGETLADIRAQLSQLSGEIAGLNQELTSTGAVSRPGGASMLERIELLEMELMRLTGRAEDLELRVNRVVKDGTNRLGDLDFRLTELEGGDVSNMAPTRPLGADRAPAASTPATPAVPAVRAAPGEQADFDRARGVLGQGDFRRAENLFATYAETWPNSQLMPDIHFLRGEAFEGLGDMAQAARSYLDSFSGYPEAARAPEALFRLGRALGRLEQVHEACITLGEVAGRYPDSPAVALAETERRVLNCQ